MCLFCSVRVCHIICTKTTFCRFASKFYGEALGDHPQPMAGTMFLSSPGCDCASTAAREKKFTNGNATDNGYLKHEQGNRSTAAGAEADQTSSEHFSDDLDVTLGFPLNRIPGAESVISQTLLGGRLPAATKSASGSARSKSDDQTLLGRLVAGLIDARTADVDRVHVTLELTDAGPEQPYRQFIGRHYRFLGFYVERLLGDRALRVVPCS